MKNESLAKMRHSCAHLLAYGVKSLFPKVKIAIGPVIENGFYYDFDFSSVKSKSINEELFPLIEKKMIELRNKGYQLTQKWLDINQAIKIFKDEPYKLEIINDIKAGKKSDFGKKGKVSIYQSGEFIDLCSGPHVDSFEKIGVFKLLSVAGAYWKGNEKNKMLTRIYGTCFFTKKELNKYLWKIKEAKKRDHRKIGKKLELFEINQNVGPGLILWLPKGNIIKEELENWAKKVEKEWDYQRVTTPHITKAGLYYTSGHLPYYKDDMYPSMKLDNNEEYFLKPMNCPHHHMIFASKQRSYKDLPLRLAEYGTCYRYESSGELFGLMRVRGLSQNDSHIYCTLDQAIDEFVKVMELHQYYYKTLGIDKYHLELSLRDPKKKDKYHGDDQMWQLAEKLMRKAVAKIDIKMVEEVGSAAFYGPKIDFIIHSSIGREFAISTNQIDLFMGKRFDLKYVDKEGKEQTPVIIHRAPLGSHERFIGFLIEHYGGNFPVWLSPIQTIIIPISKDFVDYGRDIKKTLELNNFRVELDDKDETLQNKIRKAQEQKIPHMIIIGQKEHKKKLISLRTRDQKQYNNLELEKYVFVAKDIILDKSLELWK